MGFCISRVNTNIYKGDNSNKSKKKHSAEDKLDKLKNFHTDIGQLLVSVDASLITKANASLKQTNGLDWIAKLILEFSMSEAGRTALIHKGGIDALNYMATQDNRPGVQENIAAAIANLSSTEAGKTALIENRDMIRTLTTLAKTNKTPLGLAYIAIVIYEISKSEAGRTALIDKGGIDALNYLATNYLATQDNRPGIRESIAAVFFEISTSEAGITALIDKGGIDALNHLATKVDTPMGRVFIATAIQSILFNDEGRKAVIAKGAIPALNHLAKKSNTPLEREHIAKAIYDIAKTEAGITALNENGTLTILKGLATQDNTPEGQDYIEAAMFNITTSDEEKIALIQNRFIDTLSNIYINQRTLKNLLERFTQDQLRRIIERELHFSNKTNKEREKVSAAIATIAKTEARRRALITNDNLTTLLNHLATQDNTPMGQKNIAKAFYEILKYEISKSEAGIRDLIDKGGIDALNDLATNFKYPTDDRRYLNFGGCYIAQAMFIITTSDAGKKAFIDKGGIDALNYLGTQYNNQTKITFIAKTITNIASTEAGIKALIKADTITTLIHLVTQIDRKFSLNHLATQLDRTLSFLVGSGYHIAEAMLTITNSEAGITAFIKNNGENALNQIEAQVATQKKEDRKYRKRTEKLIKEIKKRLKMEPIKKERLKKEPKQDLCCIVS